MGDNTSDRRLLCPCEQVAVRTVKVTDQSQAPLSDVVAILTIRCSESLLSQNGNPFDSLADFDAAMLAASQSAGCPQKIAFVLTGADGATFFGRVDVDVERDHQQLTAHVVELCSQLERVPELRDLVCLAQLTRSRIHLAAVQESLAATQARTAALGRRLRGLLASKR